jgi:hypothetical protein
LIASQNGHGGSITNPFCRDDKMTTWTFLASHQ